MGVSKGKIGYDCGAGNCVAILAGLTRLE